MKKYGLNELREMFLAFFESKDHLRLPSFPLIPQNDKSLLLINSGMAPMKPWFTGEQKPPRTRVCTCQKCIRTGDIENIGKTARHGTYFEMLGNFSFGDYFKREAIAWSWEFLTQVLGLPEGRLYPSVYQEDDEAFEIWHKEIGIAPERIFRFGKADNFWEHGSGPCGPCSEIYFDRGEKYGCGSPDCTVGCDCDRYIEVWNNVFSQFENDGQGNYTELAQKNIDTGMGLERLACVCQDVPSLFEVDTVMNITAKVSALTGATYGQSEKMDVSLRVITDHIRSATMMICDGVLPSNEGRGYVLRRLLRRAARHGKLLGVNTPFLYQVCSTVIDENRTAYPDLVEKEDHITRVIRMEEENFAKTIDGGMKIFSEMMAAAKARGETVFSGVDAFKLYDTYGFPIDLTMEMAEEEGLTVDQEAFRTQMEAQRQRARAARASLGDLAWAGIDFGLDSIPTKFLGYTQLEAPAKVLAIAVDEELRGELRQGQKAVIVLDQTPFYAESGGQVADWGVLRVGKAIFDVTDVHKDKGDKYLHTGIMRMGALKVGDQLEAAVDSDRRKAVMRAHSATHMLHKALRTVLGEHVQQAGSLVEPDRLRFDFTHSSPLSADELADIEQLVNEAVLEGYPIGIEEMPIAQARQKGAMALFGEKYGEKVRVVDMGGWSIELCGGTHLDSTAKVGPFHILSEFSVASGVRRIEASTGFATLEGVSQNRQTLLELAEAMKVKPDEVMHRVRQSMGELRQLRQTVEQFRDRQLVDQAGRLLLEAKPVGDLRVVTALLPGDWEADSLRKLGDFLRDKEQGVVAVLAAVKEEKITLLAVCGKQAVANGIKAGDIVRAVSSQCGGSGGGKPDSAMGGGKDPAQLEGALAAVAGMVAKTLGV